MVELLLPKNSRVKKGKNFKSKGPIENTKTFLYIDMILIQKKILELTIMI